MFFEAEPTVQQKYDIDEKLFETSQLWVKVKSDNLVVQILAQHSGKIDEK